jgi:outer membrane protein OmpA-like peptidoglycan-associated protein
MNEELVVSGFFKGRYNTNQAIDLGLTDLFPVSETHMVNIYEGKMVSTSFFKEYNPNEHIKLHRLELENVKNIEIESGENAPFKGIRVYNCKKFIIVEPKIISANYLNGKTYGEIEGKVLALTEKNPLVSRILPDKKDSDNSGINNNKGGTPYPIVTPITPQPSDNEPLPDPIINDIKKGCYDNFWKILLYTILILFLWFLFKTCNNENEFSRNCDKAEVAHSKLIVEQNRLDSIKGTMNRKIENAIANISVVYFYQNTTNFHLNSIGVNSTLDRLVKVMTSFPDSRFKIIGYHSGKEIEDATIDQKRAQKVYVYLLSKGVRLGQLVTEAKGETVLLDPKNVTYDFEGRGFNRNMRVEINLIKQ